MPDALYIHVPFCPYKCPYCDFVTHVGGAELVAPYVEALCREIEATGAEHSPHSLRTVFLGGGTPAMLAPRDVDRILEAAVRSFGIEPTAEITIEANPDVVTDASLAGFRAAGVNRLSLGAQSLDAEELRLLGRGHGPRDVEAAVLAARRAGFRAVSLDLMYGVQRQTPASWAATMESALSFEPNHLSLYSLIVESKTAYGRRSLRGELSLPPDDDVADMYLLACDKLARAGFIHYEVANWAIPGCESRHNLTYWRNEQFFAVGVGAYDYRRPYRTLRLRNTRRYIERIRCGRPVASLRDEVSPDLERFETAVMALRLLTEGLRRDAFNRRFLEGLDCVYGVVIAELTALGLLIDDGESVRLPEDKVTVANEVWERFLPASPPLLTTLEGVSDTGPPPTPSAP